MDVRLPDGTVVQNVPEGTTKAQLTEKLRRNGMMAPEESTDYRQQLDDSLSTGERFMIGAGRGALDVWEGVNQIGRQVGEWTGLADDQSVERYTAERQKERDLYDKGDLGFAGGAGRVSGNIAATAIPGGAVGRAAGITRLAQGSRTARAVANASAGGAAGATQFVEEGGSRTTNAVVGGAAGAVGGEVLERLGRRLASIPKRASLRMTRNRRYAAARQELQGQVPDEEIGRVADDIADGLTPDQALRKFEIERMGAQPTRGRLTDDVDDLKFETEQAKFSGPLADIDSQNRRAVAANLDDRVQRMAGGRETTPLAAGDDARQSIDAARSSAKERTSAAYDAAGQKLEQMGGGVRIKPTEVVTALQDDIDYLETDALKPVKSRLQRIGLLKNGEISEEVSLTPNQAEATRRILGEIAQTNNPNAKRVAGKLREALSKDVTRDAGADVFSDARGIAREQFAQFDNKAKVKALLDGKVAPERLTEKMASKSFKIADVRDVLSTLDDASPEVGQQLRGAVLNDIFGKLKGNALDTSGAPSITPATYMRRLDSIGRDKLKAIYGEDTTNELYEVAKTTARLMGTDQRVQGSKTAGEMSRRYGEMVGSLADKFPGGGLVMGLLRAARDGAKSREGERQIRRAINLEYLKRDNVRSQVRGVPDAAPAAASGSGALAASGGNG